MNENLDPTTKGYNPEELDFEKKLRPLSFDDFAGQDQILENLKVFVQAANQAGVAMSQLSGLGYAVYYNTMTIQEICDTRPPVEKTAHLYLWTTNQYLHWRSATLTCCNMAILPSLQLAEVINCRDPPAARMLPPLIAKFWQITAGMMAVWNYWCAVTA